MRTNKKFMNMAKIKIDKILITNHAIIRFKERLQFYPYNTWDNDKIEKFFISGVKEGKVTFQRLALKPGKLDIYFQYKGISFVAIAEENVIKVVTCHGDIISRKWYKYVEKSKSRYVA